MIGQERLYVYDSNIQRREENISTQKKKPGRQITYVYAHPQNFLF